MVKCASCRITAKYQKVANFTALGIMTPASSKNNQSARKKVKINALTGTTLRDTRLLPSSCWPWSALVWTPWSCLLYTRWSKADAGWGRHLRARATCTANCWTYARGAHNHAASCSTSCKRSALYCQEQCAAAAFSRSRPGADGWQETPGSRFRVISKKHLLAQSSRGAISSEPLVLVHSFNFHRRRPLLQTQICARMVALFLTPSKRTTCELFHQHCQSLSRKSSQDNVMISLDKNGVHRTLVRFVKFSWNLILKVPCKSLSARAQ